MWGSDRLKNSRRSPRHVIVGALVLIGTLAAPVGAGTSAESTGDVPDWAEAYVAPGWVLMETSNHGKTLVVAPKREVSTCVDVVGSAEEQSRSVAVAVRGDVSGCGGPMTFATVIATTKIRLQAPLAGRELLSADQGVLRRDAPIRTFDFVPPKRTHPPGLIGLRVPLVRETVEAWDLKLKILGPTSKTSYVTSQRSARKVKRGDVITVRTTKKRPPA